MSKPYEELEFTDNFMFVKVMSTYLDLCQELLELILGIRIKSLKLSSYEKTVLPAHESRGIRMDVYTEDDDAGYDIEMQAEPEISIAKRSRYYHSARDVESLMRGTDYSELKRSVVIFICKEKIGDGYTKPIYTFRYRSEEDPDTYLGDETWTVFVNAHCDDKNVSPEIREFLRFVRTNTVNGSENTLAARLSRVIEDAKKHRLWSVDYMTWEEEFRHRDFLHKKEVEKIAARAEAAETRAVAAETRAEVAVTELARYKERFGEI